MRVTGFPMEGRLGRLACLYCFMSRVCIGTDIVVTLRVVTQPERRGLNGVDPGLVMMLLLCLWRLSAAPVVINIDLARTIIAVGPC